MEIIYNKKNIDEDSLLNQEILTNKKSIWFNIDTQSEEISIEDLKDKIENSSILNYPHNFLSLDKTKQEIPPIITINLVDNINIPTSEDVFEHYNKLTGQITITEKLLFNDVLLPTSFPECLYSSVGQSKLLMFAILHEIGHALHHQIYLKEDSYLISSQHDFNNNDFLNLIADNGIYLLGKGDDNNHNKKYDINHAIKYALKEGFADLYACIGLTQIYPQEVALNFIHEIIEARNISNNNYYTTESIKQLKKDIEKNNLDLNKFDDLHSYIDNVISNTALKVMLEKLSSDNEEQIKHNNAFAGFLKSLFEKSYQQSFLNDNIVKEVNSLNNMIDILDLKNNEFNVNLNHVKENQEYFDRGYILTDSFIDDIKESEFLRLSLNCLNIDSNRISTKIQSIRQNSLKTNQIKIIKP